MKRELILHLLPLRSWNVIRSIAVLAALVVLSGCASSLRREIRSDEYQIDRKQTQIKEAQASLDADSEVYARGQCYLPDRKAKPQPFCDSKQSAREMALAKCSLSYKGCDVVSSTFKDQLDSTTERFLKSEACNRLLAAVQGDAYTMDNTVVNAVEAMADEGCKKGGLLGTLIGCSFSVAAKLQKFAQFQQCTQKTAASYYQSYTNWRDEPSDRKNRCERNIKLIAENKNDIRALENDIYAKKRTLTWRLFGDD